MLIQADADEGRCGCRLMRMQADADLKSASGEFRICNPDMFISKNLPLLFSPLLARIYNPCHSLIQYWLLYSFNYKYIQ